MKKKHYLIAIAVCLLAAVGVFYYYLMSGFSTSEDTQYVYIDDNDNLDSVSNKLLPIASEPAITAFKMLARHSGYAEKIRSGRYAIKPGENAITVFRNLKNGHQEPVMLTIPESRTMDRLAGSLGRKLMVDSTALAILLQDNDFCQRYGCDTATIACLFVPNTYEVYWNTSIENLMERMKKEHQHFWNDERTKKASAIGLTPNEVCTLASIIDEETANNAEKPMIAGMYLNRIKQSASITTCSPSTVPIIPTAMQVCPQDPSRLPRSLVSTRCSTEYPTTIYICAPKRTSRERTISPSAIRSIFAMPQNTAKRLMREGSSKM